MKRTNCFRVFYYASILLCAIASGMASATSSLEVGQVTLPATTNNSFTSFNFNVPFAAGVIPNVFVMTTDDGTDPCTVRIRNVTNVGFEAVCLEPENEDGTHPGMVVDYIAIVDGITTIPVNGGGSVVFESGCLETNAQYYSTSNCANCSGTVSYITQNFTTSFSSTPALLTQVQTTNNTNPNTTSDPAFIDTAVRNVGAASFQVSNNQMEAGNGPLSNDERICYLATEIDSSNRCKDLNLSSLNGPASVVFEAVNGGNNVDGWSNGCTSGEGASFSSGCFSSAPIAVAKQRTLNGSDGGFLRRCSVSSSQTILTFDEDQISNTERAHIDEAVSVFAFGSTLTTPVTLSHVRITQQDRHTVFNWQTATETFHLGFNLWGELEGQWVQLNNRLIIGSSHDTLKPQRYSDSLKLSRHQANNISQFGLSSVDLSGNEEFFGPFKVNQSYGEQHIAEAIDWQHTRQQFAKSMSDKGYTLVNGQWRKIDDDRKAKLANKQLAYQKAVVNLGVNQTGIHAVSYSELNQAGIDWHNRPIQHIALTLNGKAMPRHIVSTDSVFNEGDQIVFVGSLPTGSDAIYIDKQVYQLRLDKQRVINANQFQQAIDQASEADERSLFTQTLTSNQQHSPIMNAEDAWYDSRLVSIGGTPAKKQYSFSLDALHSAEHDARVNIALFGGIDLSGDPSTQPDHHVQIVINNTVLKDIYFDGLTEYLIEASVPANLLTDGDNVLEIVVAGDTGHIADIVYINTIDVATSQPLQVGQYLNFEGSTQATAFRVNTAAAPASDWQVYAYQDNGSLSYVTDTQQAQHDLLFMALPTQHGNTNINYAVGHAQSWLKAESVEVMTAQDLTDEAANLLVIAHPHFINDDLQQYLEHKAEYGIKARIIDWLEIVETYGYGNNTPQALNHFLQRADAVFDYQYVLIVGGHTLDYLGYSQQTVVNFIPTHYRKVSAFAKAPTDTPYVDLNSNGLPDKAIGRWPVRSQQDLAVIIKKTMDWQHNIANNTYHDALLIADQADNDNTSFQQSIEQYVGKHLKADTDINNIHTVFVDELLEQDLENPIQTARQTIIDRINDGVSLTAYNGHGSPTAWTRNSLFNANSIQQLDNAGKPTIVLPLACYTTYYESLSINTLAHQWLFSGDKGAVAIHGAAVLGQYRENALFAERALEQQIEHRKDLGGSILAVKQSMAPWNEMVNNWTLLGDPSLPLKSDYVHKQDTANTNTSQQTANQRITHQQTSKQQTVSQQTAKQPTVSQQTIDDADDDQQHSPIMSHTEDNGYHTRLVNLGSPTLPQYSFKLDTVNDSGNTKLKITFSGDKPNHHVQILLNNDVLKEIDFDDLTEQSIEVDLPQDLLTISDNVLSIAILDDHDNITDIIHIDTANIANAEASHISQQKQTETSEG